MPDQDDPQDDAQADQDESQAAPPPPGHSYSTWGPIDGPILRRHEPPALGVVGEPGGAWPILGIAFPIGQVEHRRGPAATFRLVIGEVELEGQWLCVGRRFVRLGEAAEFPSLRRRILRDRRIR